MQQGIYMRQAGPNYVYIKYRCSRCKKLGELYVKHEEWQDSLLHEHTSEQTQDERQRFTQLGAITLAEMRRFHHALEDMNAFPDLMVEETE